MMDKPFDPNDLVSKLFGPGSDHENGDWNYEVPEELFYVPGDLKIFTYSDERIDANEIFKLREYVMFNPELTKRWKQQAIAWLKAHQPEYAEAELLDDIFAADDFDGTEQSFELPPQTERLSMDEIFSAREADDLTIIFDHDKFDFPKDKRENWESYPLLAQVRADPKKTHLVPDWTGTLSYTLSAMALYGWITYERHKTLRAYHVKAKA